MIRSSTGRMIMTMVMMVLIRRMSVTMRMRMAKVRKEGGATRMEPETVSSGFAPLKSNDQDFNNIKHNSIASFGKSYAEF